MGLTVGRKTAKKKLVVRRRYCQFLNVSRKKANRKIFPNRKKSTVSRKIAKIFIIRRNSHHTMALN